MYAGVQLNFGSCDPLSTSGVSTDDGSILLPPLGEAGVGVCELRNMTGQNSLGSPLGVCASQEWN